METAQWIILVGLFVLSVNSSVQISRITKEKKKEASNRSGGGYYPDRGEDELDSDVKIK